MALPGFQALPTLKAMFPRNYVLDVCLAWLAGPRLGVQRVPASEGNGIASAHLTQQVPHLFFDVLEI
jgi:hypothetical protein